MTKLGVQMMYSLGTGEIKTYILEETFNETDDIDMYVENLMGRKTIFLEKANMFISTRAVIGFNVFENK